MIDQTSYSQPEMYCKTCGALIPDSNDRRDMGEGYSKPSLLGCRFCCLDAGGKLPKVSYGRPKLRELESKGQERFNVPVLVIK